MFEILINNIIPFVVILTVLVFVHELGHYSIARYNGVKVEVFSIGFGKELFGFTDNSGTRWKFSLVPLGGYVKMHGDLDEASSKKNTKNINPDESFHEKTLNQRSWILFAGPAANFIFSFIVLIFINTYFGYSENIPRISFVDKEKSAFKVGLREGDTIIEVNKQKINNFSDLQKVISSNNNRLIEINFIRGDKVKSVSVKVEKNIIGIRGTLVKKKLSFISSITKSSEQIVNFLKLTITGVYEIITGTRGADELGGPIRIAELSGDFWQKGIESTLWFMMIISLNLGLINLFPIPMLDGGHLLLNLVEFVNGKPLNQKYLELAHTFGFFILISLMIFATYNDISRFFD